MSRLSITVLVAALIRTGLAAPDDRDEIERAYSSFLQTCSLRATDIYFDSEITLYGKESARLLLAAGQGTQYLAALSDEGSFVYIKMPWRERSDFREARIVDLAGDGRQALVTRYRDRGDDGDTREMVAMWRLPSESHIRRVFASRSDRSLRFVLARPRQRSGDYLGQATCALPIRR
jgi:hypothetical protein